MEKQQKQIRLLQDDFQSLIKVKYFLLNQLPVANAAGHHEWGHLVVVFDVQVEILPLDVEDGLDHACLAVLASQVQPSISYLRFSVQNVRKQAWMF